MCRITPFQSKMLRIIAMNRSRESHIAGGVALNFTPESPRYSADLDVFHDAEEAVSTASDRDCACLKNEGFTITRRRWEPAYRRVWVEHGGEGTKIEWAQDSAWRFFPAQSDPVLCWRLHPFDALTNKALAMGARAETRDMIGLVFHTMQFPLSSVVWAACCKDPGWTPMLLLEPMRRNARVEPVAIEEMRARIEPSELKSRWLQCAEEAETRFLHAAQADIEIGVAFLSSDGVVAPGTTYPTPNRSAPLLAASCPASPDFNYPVD